MIARLFWIACILAIGAVTVAVQLDRQAASSPGLAQIVPEPVRSGSQNQMVSAALAGDNLAKAISEAERLVRRRPIPAEHLTLLAIARARAQQAEASALAIQFAAQRGWREPIAQEAMLRIAVEAGDQSEAARRYAALFLRDATPDTLLEEFGPVVLGDANGEGQQTMITIVGGGERWRNYFLRRAPRVMPPAAFSAIVTATSANGVRYDCELLARAQVTVTARDATAGQGILALLGQQCPDGSRPLP